MYRMRRTDATQGDHIIGLAVLAVAFLACGVGGAADEEGEPVKLNSARKAYDTACLQVLDPIQRKYQGALEQYRGSFTQSGNLDAAKEAQGEWLQAKEWQTLPTGQAPGARTLQEAQLTALLGSYEAAVLTGVKPINQRHVEELKQLKTSYAQAGELDAAIQVEERLKQVQAGKALPVNEGARRYLEGLTKDEFGEWLKRQEFEFHGKAAGRKWIKFDNVGMKYGTEDSAPVVEYELTGNRKIDIGGGLSEGGFEMVFERGLQAALFISRRGEYPVTFNPDYSQDGGNGQ